MGRIGNVGSGIPVQPPLNNPKTTNQQDNTQQPLPNQDSGSWRPERQPRYATATILGNRPNQQRQNAKTPRTPPNPNDDVQQVSVPESEAEKAQKRQEELQMQQFMDQVRQSTKGWQVDSFSTPSATY